MSLSTYTGLLTAVGEWLERGDTSEVAPDWVALAEARMNRDLRVNDMLERSTALITDGYSAVPDDFLAPRSMRLVASPYTLLQFVTPEQMADAKYQEATGSVPQFYALVGSEFEYGPVPTGDDVSVMLTYYTKIPALTESNTSNWVLANHPDAYLRGALMEGYLYYLDQTNAAAQQALFEAALDGIRRASRTSLAANLSSTPSQYPI